MSPKRNQKTCQVFVNRNSAAVSLHRVLSHSVSVGCALHSSSRHGSALTDTTLALANKLPSSADEICATADEILLNGRRTKKRRPKGNLPPNSQPCLRALLTTYRMIFDLMYKWFAFLVYALWILRIMTFFIGNILAGTEKKVYLQRIKRKYMRICLFRAGIPAETTWPFYYRFNNF